MGNLLSTNHKVTVWINARFLDRPITGVERVAREMISALVKKHLDKDGCWPDGGLTYNFKLIAPRTSTSSSPWPELVLDRRGILKGHLWEQVELPRITQGDLLISLCNTGPLRKNCHIVFLHDAQPFAIPKNFSFSFRMWYRILFKQLSSSANRVLVNSKFTLDELVKYVQLDPAKANVCYLGADHVRNHCESANDLGRFKLPNEQFLLAVSSSNRNKNFSAVVKALEILGEDAPHCVIVGCKDQAHFEGAVIDSEKICHLGYVSDNELIALYRRALCLVFPSFYEGFGLPPLEAMTVGCPVVVSNTSALPEIAGTSAEFCDPEEPSSLAAAINHIRGSTKRRTSLVEAGSTRANQFTWQKCADILLVAVSETAKISPLKIQSCKSV